MNRATTALILTVFLTAAAQAAGAEGDAGGISLSKAVGDVLSRNPGLAAGRAQVRGAKASQNAVMGMRMPQFRARTAYTRGDDPVYVFGTLLRQQNFTANNFAIDKLNDPTLYKNFSSGLEVGIPIFAALELDSMQRLTGIQHESELLSLARAEQQTRYHVVDAYLRVLKGRLLVAELDQRVSDSERDLESAKSLNKKGLVLGSDYEAARAIFGGLKLRRVAASRALAASHSTLAALLGESGRGFAPTGSLAAPAYTLDSELSLLAAVGEGRPDIKQAALGTQAAEVMSRKETASILPRVEAFGMLETNTDDFNKNPLHRLFGVRASLLFGDFSYLPRRAKAKAMSEASAGYRDFVKEKASIEVSQAYQRYQGAAESVPLAKETVERAAESLKLFWPLYREGRQSIIEVLRAEDGLAEAQAGYLESLYQAHAGYAALHLAAGTLDDAAVRTIEETLSEESR